jgi:hypothetical protein
MESSIIQPNPLMSFLPLLILMIPLIFIIRKLAMEKGKNVILWTVLACIPVVNFVILWYIRWYTKQNYGRQNG